MAILVTLFVISIIVVYILGSVTPAIASVGDDDQQQQQQQQRDDILYQPQFVTEEVPETPLFSRPLPSRFPGREHVVMGNGQIALIPRVGKRSTRWRWPSLERWPRLHTLLWGQ